MVSVSVEFHIMRLIFVYSVILGLNLHCGVKKIGVVEFKRSKEIQRDNLIMSIRASIREQFLQTTAPPKPLIGF